MNNPYKSPEVPEEYQSLTKLLRDIGLTILVWFITLSLFPLFYTYTVTTDKRLRMALWPVLDLMYLFVIITVWIMAWVGTYRFILEII